MSNSLSYCSSLRIAPAGVKALIASSSSPSWIFKSSGNLAQCLKHSPPVSHCWTAWVPFSPRSGWFCCKQCSVSFPPTSKSPALTVLAGRWTWFLNQRISLMLLTCPCLVAANLHKVSTCQRKTAVFPWSQNPTVSEEVALHCGAAGTGD